jgi:glucokinase
MILVADVGGTHTRFALARRAESRWRFEQLKVQPTARDTGSAIRQYLSNAGDPAIEALACCGAGPVTPDGCIRLTNTDTVLAPATLALAAGVREVILVNDFAAVARAIPELPPEAFLPRQDDAGMRDAPRVVIGAGTGLGVALLAPVADGWRVIPGEGGHADLAPVDEEQLRVWQELRTRYGRVSAETVLSGPGLERLHAARIRGPARGAAEIAAAAWRGEPEAAGTVRMFTRWLGSFAGNLALTAGAQGGVYLAGGIVPAWGPGFDLQVFRQSFEDKPPFADWLRRIPSYVVTYPQPGLYGLAALAATSPP